MQKPYLEAGKIVNTHGVRGEVRIQPWADDAAFLLGFRTFYIDGAPVHVAHSRAHKGMLVVKFQGVDDVNAAMTMKNRVVSIARAYPRSRNHIFRQVPGILLRYCRNLSRSLYKEYQSSLHPAAWHGSFLTVLPPEAHRKNR